MVNGENLFQHGSPKLVPPAPCFGVHWTMRTMCSDTRARASGKGSGMNPTKSESVVSREMPVETRRDTLTITDNRNGRQYEIPVKSDTIRALDLRPIKIHDADFGMMSYDPALTNTASCTSKITFIDGDK